jgi:hypothetical protein
VSDYALAAIVTAAFSFALAAYSAGAIAFTSRRQSTLPDRLRSGVAAIPVAQRLELMDRRYVRFERLKLALFVGFWLGVGSGVGALAGLSVSLLTG